MLAFWRTCGYFNIISNKSQKKTAKNELFLVILRPFEGYAQDSEQASEFFLAFDDKGGHN